MPFAVVMLNWWQCLAEQQTGFCLFNTSLKLSFFIQLETPKDSTKTVIASIKGFLTPPLELVSGFQQTWLFVS